jgi:hypothetical protein
LLERNIKLGAEALSTRKFAKDTAIIVFADGG